MKKIRFRCQGCGQMYTLGEDAIVVTAAGVRDDFVGVTMFGVSGGISTGGGPESPDLVGSLAAHNRSWSSLEPSEIRRQEAEVSRVMSSLSVGQSRWWRCRGCGTVQTYELIRTRAKRVADKTTAQLPSKQFEGKTVEEAKAAAMAAFPEERIVSLKVTSRGRKKTIQRQRESAAAAVEAVKAGVPSEVSDVGPAEIIEEGQRGTVEVLADSEDEARIRWRDKAPRGSSCERVECVRAPATGVLGIGARQGLWRVHWSTKFKARISFRTPVVVTVWYSDTTVQQLSDGPSALLEYLDQSEGTDELYEMLRTRSVVEIEQLCREFPIETLRLDGDSIQQDFRNSKRFELVTVLAEIFVKYDEILEQSPELRLPSSLPAGELAKTLMSRLMPFIRSQQSIEIAYSLRGRLYDFAMALIQAGRNQDALTCLLVSRPTGKEDHDFWICACGFNIAQTTKDPVDIAAAIEAAEQIVNGNVTVPKECVQGARRMLRELEEQPELESRQDLIDCLSGLRPLNLGSWIRSGNANRFGPCVPHDTHLAGQFSTPGEVVDFIDDQHQRSLGYCELEWKRYTDEVVVADFYTRRSGCLDERYVILRRTGGPTDYICYLAWIA